MGTQKVILSSRVCRVLADSFPIKKKQWEHSDYLQYLGEKLGYTKLEDWYQLTLKDIQKHAGKNIVSSFYRSSPALMVMENFKQFKNEKGGEKEEKENHEWMPWMFFTSPPGCWEKEETRKSFFKYLGNKLGYTKMEDWYNLSLVDCRAHARGSELIRQYGQGSVSKLVMNVLHEHHWIPWKFRVAPRHFWDDPANRLWFLKYLGNELGYTQMSDWYRVTYADFSRHGGASIFQRSKTRTRFLTPETSRKNETTEMENSAKPPKTTKSSGTRERDSPAKILFEAFPEHEWEPWRFGVVSRGFWDSVDNHRQFLLNLGKKKGYTTLDDYYSITIQDISENGGIYLITKFYDSVFSFLSSVFPEHKWIPWKFNSSRASPFSTPENTKKYVHILEEELGIKEINDWYRISYDNIKSAGLPDSQIKKLTFSKILREVYPDHKWDMAKLRISGAKMATQRWVKVLLKRLLPLHQVFENYSHPNVQFSSSGSPCLADICIPSLNLVIEFHGEHHNKEETQREYFGNTKRIPLLDVDKKDKFEALDFTFIEIPSWWDNNPESLISIIQARRPDIIFNKIL